MHTVSQIAPIINAAILQLHDDATIEHLLLDSRKLLFPKTSLFFALGGPRRSGSFFIEELYEKGVRNFVVDESVSINITKFSDANFLQTKNVLVALQLLATQHRKKFHIPVIGITGSNGKTIVKEFLYQLLADNYNIARSPKSYNSQIGVPLSVWPLNNQHTLGIFEAGISKPGEMQQLEKIIAPTIGVFTNIGEAHSEGFENIQQKIHEKLHLFANSEWLVFGIDNNELKNAVIDFAKNKNKLIVFTWGKSGDASLQIVSIEKKEQHTIVTAIIKHLPGGHQKAAISIPFTDDAYIEDAIICWSVLLCLAVSQQDIEAKMQQLKAVEMRLEMKQGINHCSIINDSYNADINSLGIALDFLAHQQQHINRTIILSDILQSGKTNETLYEQVAMMLQQKRINRLIGIGPGICKQHEAFRNLPQSVFFASVADFKMHFHTLHFFNETILLKGARVFEFEQISHLLEEKTHQTVLEINLTAITHNLKQYQQLLNPGVKLMAMVKAFSYGSGSFEIANLLQFHKVDYLAVAFADEGVELRKAGITLPIMVMGPDENTFDLMVQYDLEPELYSFKIFHAFQQYLMKAGIENYPAHIKIDSGMHRLGFEEHDMQQLKVILQQSTHVKLQSVFSHLVASDNDAHDGFTIQQGKIFASCCQQIQEALPYTFIKHIANTSGIMRHKELQLDMVRLGIGLYGVDGNPKVQSMLQNVTTLKTTIAQIRKIKAGESVGYNRAGVVKKDSVIATVRIGYADGYPRLLGNGNGKMLVNGQLAPIIGNVCMDMVMLDITGIAAEEGDEAIVFGKDLPVANVAQWANTIGYEILAGISQRVKRVYYEE